MVICQEEQKFSLLVCVYSTLTSTQDLTLFLLLLSKLRDFQNGVGFTAPRTTSGARHCLRRDWRNLQAAGVSCQSLEAKSHVYFHGDFKFLDALEKRDLQGRYVPGFSGNAVGSTVSDTVIKSKTAAARWSQFHDRR